MYLRHVGRDGCVNVELMTYDVGPQMAGRTVLLQVRAESRQVAVWSQDQIVKLLPSPRFDGPGDDPGRLSAVHQARGIGSSTTCFCSFIQESPAIFAVGGRSLITSFICRLSQALVSRAGKWREHVVSGQAKTPGSEAESCCTAIHLRLTARSSSTRTSVSLFRLSFSLFNPCYFDEATPPALSMTESRTPCALRGHSRLTHVSNVASCQTLALPDQR